MPPAINVETRLGRQRHGICPRPDQFYNGIARTADRVPPVALTGDENSRGKAIQQPFDGAATANDAASSSTVKSELVPGVGLVHDVSADFVIVSAQVIEGGHAVGDHNDGTLIHCRPEDGADAVPRIDRLVP